ncbi:hypothetical protein ACFL4R_00455 [Nitrospirota bacterium]
MRRDNAFVLSMAVQGIVLAFVLVGVFGAIAVPSLDNYILTHEEKADLDRMAESFSFAMYNPEMLALISVPFILVAFILFLKVLNPNIKLASFKTLPGFVKASVSIILALAVYGAVLIYLDEWSFSALSVGKTLAFLSAAGMLWVVAGEAGWAGDLSSWRSGGNSDGLSLKSSFFYGIGAGAFLILLVVFGFWAFNKYFILVSEVLDGSGETSYAGFRYLLYGMIFVLSFSLAASAAAIAAIAPVNTDRQTRILNLMRAVSIVLVYFIVSLGFYVYAADKYDLGKKNLAEAVGIPEKASEDKTLVVLAPTGDNETPVLLKKWPMQAKAFNFVGDYTVDASPESLLKISSYLQEHNEGSVYRYASMGAIYVGHFNSLDAERGASAMVEAARELLLPRMLMLWRLQYSPATEVNIAILKAFADQDKWYVGGRSAERIAIAMARFGMPDEAEKWFELAKDSAPDNEVVLPEAPVLLDGSVSGRVMLNDAPLKGVRVGLMHYQGEFDDINDNDMQRLLLASQEVDVDGSFRFDALTSGSYHIALLADEDAIPSDLEMDKLTLDNIPGVITLDKGNSSAELGNIALSF